MLKLLGLSPTTAVYLFAVLGLGASLLLQLLVVLSRSQKTRKAQLDDRRWLDAVRMKSPVDDPVGQARDRGFATIERNTTITRRALVPLIILLTAALAGIPFLDRVPGAALSVIVAASTVLAGLAARPIIENAFAGLVIAYSKLLNIGDQSPSATSTAPWKTSPSRTPRSACGIGGDTSCRTPR